MIWPNENHSPFDGKPGVYVHMARNGVSYHVSSDDGQRFHIAAWEGTTKNETIKPVSFSLIGAYLKQLGLRDPINVEWKHSPPIVREPSAPDPVIEEAPLPEAVDIPVVPDAGCDDRRGYVYILTNEFMPGLVKIGKTAGLSARVSDLSRPTGVPGIFKVAFAAIVDDRHVVEKAMHTHFAYARIGGKEFFAVDVADAIDALNDLSNITALRAVQ